MKHLHNESRRHSNEDDIMNKESVLFLSEGAVGNGSMDNCLGIAWANFDKPCYSLCIFE